MPKVVRFWPYGPDLQAQSRPFVAAASQTELAIAAKTYVLLSQGSRHRMVSFDEAYTFSLASILDTGVVQAAKDYSLYLVEDGPVIASLNSTFPAGYDADTSRKIGGLHTLCANAGVIAGHPLSGYVAGAILPQSVWCLNQKPKYASPAGMAFDPLSNLWWDIYLQSSTGATTASAYGAVITDTRTWPDFVADLAAVGKRLPFDWEFQAAAKGSNGRTNIAGSADPVTTGGHSDTAGRRMISNIGLEDMCGAMWQWLQDQGYRFDIGVPTYTTAAQTLTIYHAAAPGGNPIYVKFGVDGTPYLCCNLATAAADKVVSFGAYKLVIKHDANAAVGGLPLYFDDDATLPFRFLINNTVYGKDVFAFANDPNFLLFLKHDANAATTGVAVTYDDGADNRLEYISPHTANATQDLCNAGPAWGYQDLGAEGQLYKQGTYGDIKLLAGGSWSLGTICGPRCRNASCYRWNATTFIGARGCAEPL